MKGNKATVNPHVTMRVVLVAFHSLCEKPLALCRPVEFSESCRISMALAARRAMIRIIKYITAIAMVYRSTLHVIMEIDEAAISGLPKLTRHCARPFEHHIVNYTKKIKHEWNCAQRKHDGGDDSFGCNQAWIDKRFGDR